MTTDSRCAGAIPCYLNDNGECVATDDWMCTRPQWTHERPLRVVTLCSGYDSQCLALDALKEHYPSFDYDLVAWAEFDPASKQPIEKQPAAYVIAGNSIVAGGNYTDENGNVDGVLYNIFRKLLIETGRDKQPNDQLSLF